MENIIEAILFTALFIIGASMLPEPKREKPVGIRDVQSMIGFTLLMLFGFCRIIPWLCS